MIQMRGYRSADLEIRTRQSWIIYVVNVFVSWRWTGCLLLHVMTILAKGQQTEVATVCSCALVYASNKAGEGGATKEGRERRRDLNKGRG